MTHRDLRHARLVLASASPRRAMLLGQLGLAPVVDPSSSAEVVPPGVTPAGLVEVLALEKAEEVAGRHGDADLVIGADTVVVQAGAILGKPRDVADAHRMLRGLAGAWHQVYTGYALLAPREGRRVVGHARSEVAMRPLSDAEIAAYVATGEPMDKAGAYAIQALGAALVQEIRGDYTNIVGLPVPSLDAAWRELGWSLL
ncbi:MAG: Maf family protein [Candidatus Sericytochromatia bacterium]|nr:Maf family protein [Candidatus Sericytochromatia bacterium]